MSIYLGYPVASELSARVREVIRTVREEPPATRHRVLLTETIITMTDTGIDFYALEIVRRMALGKSVDRFVALALTTVRSGLHMIINRIGRRLSEEQFYPLVDFLEEILLPMNTRWYVAFPAPPALVAQLQQYGQQVREQPPARAHAWACYELIAAFKQAALDFFFVQSTERLGVGDWGQRVVSSGITMAHSTSNRLLRRVIGRLSDEALISIAEFYDSVLLVRE